MWLFGKEGWSPSRVTDIFYYMEKRINDLHICEKLAGCPKGTKLWSPIFGECEFLGLSRDLDDEPEKDRFWVCTDELGNVTFTDDGRFFSTSEECLIFPSWDNRDWSTWANPKPKVERFDPKTLKPFDKVLVRDCDSQTWRPALFSRFDPLSNFPVILIMAEASERAVPYNEETARLVNTMDEAPEYYRWWEDAK